jgi:hypothetical protein
MTLRISEASISGYRSIKNLYLPIEPLSVFVGENGVEPLSQAELEGMCARLARL